MGKPQAVIFDVDGTLCDISPVLHYLTTPGKPKDFNAFHAGSVDCPPHHWVLRAAQDYADMGVAPVVVTARRSRWMYHTLIWLTEHGVPHAELFMRDDKDGRPDDDVKRDILATIRARYDVLCAYDDNPRVLALWDAEGVPTVVAPGWSFWEGERLLDPSRCYDCGDRHTATTCGPVLTTV